MLKTLCNKKYLKNLQYNSISSYKVNSIFPRNRSESQRGENASTYVTNISDKIRVLNRNMCRPYLAWSTFARLLLDFCSTFAQLILDFCSTLLGFRVSLFVTNGHVTFNPNVDLLAFILQLQDCDYKLYAYL